MASLMPVYPIPSDYVLARGLIARNDRRRRKSDASNTHRPAMAAEPARRNTFDIQQSSPAMGEFCPVNQSKMFVPVMLMTPPTSPVASGFLGEGLGTPPRLSLSSIPEIDDVSEDEDDEVFHVLERKRMRCFRARLIRF
ncbi:hypothetical protein EC988_000312 [Linderina pennispora]|nr:hypothetical protein EC988_000312 [Linderina pennispora]